MGLATLLMPTLPKAETVYTCQTKTQIKYQDSPCSANDVSKKLPIQPFTADPITLERLEQQRMDYLQSANPAEYRQLKRAKMTPEQRLADEKLEQEQIQQQIQQRQVQQQRQLLERQQQLEQQLAQQQFQQRQLEQQLETQRWQWRYLNIHPHPWQHSIPPVKQYQWPYHPPLPNSKP